MTSEPGESVSTRRGSADRRARPTRAFSLFLFRGRRRRARRASDARGGYYVDHLGSKAVAAGVALLLLTLLDGVFTLRLLDGGATEANPVMAYSLSLGVSAFLIVKYLLTVPSVGVLLIHKNFAVLHPRFRVKWIVLGILSVYGVLIGYELALFGLMAYSG